MDNLFLVIYDQVFGQGFRGGFVLSRFLCRLGFCFSGFCPGLGQSQVSVWFWAGLGQVQSGVGLVQVWFQVCFRCRFWLGFCVSVAQVQFQGQGQARVVHAQFVLGQAGFRVRLCLGQRYVRVSFQFFGLVWGQGQDQLRSLVRFLFRLGQGQVQDQVSRVGSGYCFLRFDLIDNDIRYLQERNYKQCRQ